MANYYVSSVAYTAVAQWSASGVRSLGAYVRQLATPTVNNERVFKCTTAGTSAGSEPTWVLTAAATTTDGTAVWTECTGMEAEQVAANWRAPAARVNAFPSGRAVLTTVGNFVFVSSDHAETQATAVTWAGGTFGQTSVTSIISVSRAGGSSLPPVSADLTIGGSITLTSTAVLSISGMMYVRGMTLNAYRIYCQNGAGSTILRDCSLYCQDTGTQGGFYIDANSNTTTTAATEWHNVQLSFAGVNCKIFAGNVAAALYWHETSSPLIGGSAMPTSLFLMTGAGMLRVRGVDLSAFTGNLFSNNTSRNEAYISNCKINASAVLSTFDYTTVDHYPVCFDNCDDGTNNRTYRMARVYGSGVVTTNASAVRSGGATDGTTAISWKMVHTLQNALSTLQRLRSPGIIARVSSGLASSHSASIEIAYVGSAALTTLQAWLELEYLGDSGSPLSSFVRGGPTDNLPGTVGSSVTTSTATWSATARQNSHAYAVGDTIAVSGNVGRVFYCTTAGTSAGTEPVGFASAVDGGAVTDSAATFRCLVRHSLSVSFTPQRAGFVTGIVRFGAGVSTVLFVDPHMTVT
jgi:hypothetical protein